jgi:hypothetical protein
MSDNEKRFLWGLVAFLVLSLSFMLGNGRGGSSGQEQTQAIAAQTECARYHPETGKFEWLEEQE